MPAAESPRCPCHQQHQFSSFASVWLAQDQHRHNSPCTPTQCHKPPQTVQRATPAIEWWNETTSESAPGACTGHQSQLRRQDTLAIQVSSLYQRRYSLRSDPYPLIQTRHHQANLRRHATPCPHSADSPAWWKSKGYCLPLGRRNANSAEWTFAPNPKEGWVQTSIQQSWHSFSQVASSWRLHTHLHCRLVTSIHGIRPPRVVGHIRHILGEHIFNVENWSPRKHPPDSHQAVEPKAIKCIDYYNIENTDMYYTCTTLFGQTPAPVDMVNIFWISKYPVKYSALTCFDHPSWCRMHGLDSTGSASHVLCVLPLALSPHWISPPGLPHQRNWSPWTTPVVHRSRLHIHELYRQETPRENTFKGGTLINRKKGLQVEFHSETFQGNRDCFVWNLRVAPCLFSSSNHSYCKKKHVQILFT